MAMGGWGKRAANRIDRKQFEQDELLKSLGTQFNVDFTGYEQWQRQTKVVKPVQKLTFAKTTSDETFVVGRVKSSDSGRHIITNKEKKTAAKLEEEEKQRAERIKMLKLRLRTRKQAVSDYLRRYNTLLDENIRLKEAIEGKEKEASDSVKKLLRKYEKFRGGMSNLQSNFTKELNEAKFDFEQTRKRLQKQIDVLNRRIAEVDRKLDAQNKELKILLSYKDKEYPVKAMQISNLQKEIEQLSLSYREEQEELEHIINLEVSKNERKRIQLTNQITRNVSEDSLTEFLINQNASAKSDFSNLMSICSYHMSEKELIQSAVDLMHPSLKDMALQNMVMAKEIDFHLKEQEDLESSNSVLEARVKELLEDPKSNIRLQMFPEFFPLREKCSPDMDVVLDIPTKKWLPI